MKRMLVNATQPEELRVALVDGQRLYDLDIESTGKEQKKSNIYKGKIIRIEPSLEAAFVDYGAERHGFLPLKEVSRSEFRDGAKSSNGRVNIKDALSQGQELIVQVEKEERGNKGAALTTFISLAGRYLVAMPNNPRAGGVSRQIEGDDRDEAREAMSGLDIPSDVGLILRTAGVGKSTEELQWDLDYLLQLWRAIDTASGERKAPFLIFQDQNVIIRAIRDYLRNDIAEILVDDSKLYELAQEFMTQVMPHNLSKLKLYNDSVPLFNRYQIESQIESAFSRQVRLPSGGSIVIEPTEALTTIDINSARATQGSDIEETAHKTNLEAAEEIGRQLRLRDLGGLVVIDFIDMLSNKNQRAVENRLRDAMKVDRARIQIGRISRFGLLEMSRQRLRPSLAESSHELCPRCEGVGHIRSVKSTALGVLRMIEEEAMKDSTAKVSAQVPVDVATFLLNEKRQDVSGIEERQNVQILLIPNQNMETPHFDIQRIREQDLSEAELGESYEMVSEAEPPSVDFEPEGRAAAPQAAVQDISRQVPKPTASESAQESGLLSRIASALFGQPGAKSEQPAEKPKQQDNRNKQDKPRDSRSNQQRDGDSRRGRGNNRRGGKQRGAEGRGQGQDNDKRSDNNRNGNQGERKRGGRRGRRGGGGGDRNQNAADNNQNTNGNTQNKDNRNQRDRKPRQDNNNERNRDRSGRQRGDRNNDREQHSDGNQAQPDNRDTQANVSPATQSDTRPAATAAISGAAAVPNFDDSPTIQNPAPIPEHVEIVKSPDPEKFRDELAQIVNSDNNKSPSSDTAPVKPQQNEAPAAPVAPAPAAQPAASSPAPQGMEKSPNEPAAPASPPPDSDAGGDSQPAKSE